MAAEWTRRDVTTPGGTFVVHEAGPAGDGGGPVLLYLHSEMDARPSPLAGRLAERLRVVAPVHPGFGDAERPEWVESIRDVAEHYADLLDELGLGSELVLVGESMGAWIAVELALRLRGAVTGLSLVAPIGIRVPGHPAGDFWFVREREEMLFDDLSVIPRLSGAEQVANEESAARYGWSPRLYDPTLAPRMHRLQARTQIVWAADDRLLPAEHLSAWQTLIPSATVETVSDSGHFPGYEQPAVTASAVEAFLATPAMTGADR
jgi:pimeloyl-ACP methyl ester carboxylesterase